MILTGDPPHAIASGCALLFFSNIESHTSQAGELSSLYSYLILRRSRDFAIQNPCSVVSHHVLLMVRMHFFLRSPVVGMAAFTNRVPD